MSKSAKFVPLSPGTPACQNWMLNSLLLKKANLVLAQLLITNQVFSAYINPPSLAQTRQWPASHPLSGTTTTLHSTSILLLGTEEAQQCRKVCSANTLFPWLVLWVSVMLPPFFFDCCYHYTLSVPFVFCPPYWLPCLCLVIVALA